MPRKPKYSKDRLSLISKVEQLFERKIVNLQSAFQAAILNHYISEFAIKENTIKLNNSNLSSANNLKIVQEQFYRKKTTPVLGWFARRLFDVILINRQYFRANSNSSVSRVKDAVENRMLRSYGVTKRTGRLVIQKGGWLHTLGEFSDPYQRVKEVAVQAVRREMGITAFKRLIKDNINPSGKLGPIQHHFRTHAGDAFAEFNRLTSSSYSDKLGMRAWMFNGGIIDNTRNFCRLRDGTVVIQEDIDLWPGMVGRTDGPQWAFGAYDAKQHIGGHNCRHILDPIADKIAIRIRPELADIWGIKN